MKLQEILKELHIDIYNDSPEHVYNSIYEVVYLQDSTIMPICLDYKYNDGFVYSDSTKDYCAQEEVNTLKRLGYIVETIDKCEDVELRMTPKCKNIGRILAL